MAVTTARPARATLPLRSRNHAAARTNMPTAPAATPWIAPDSSVARNRRAATAALAMRQGSAHRSHRQPQTDAGRQMPRYADAKSGLPSDAMIGLNSLFQLIGSTPAY